jgi:GntR family transcriptional regulator
MTTLHAKIAQNILEQINAGVLKVGGRLPPEEVFAAELGVSRQTLRRAFSDLAAVGVLRRKKTRWNCNHIGSAKTAFQHGNR